jgi:hypothetical protein
MRHVICHSVLKALCSGQLPTWLFIVNLCLRVIAMKHLYLILVAIFTFSTYSYSQPCSTTNGTNCLCPDGTTNCDLLPDIMISWYGLITDTPTEYSQTGNGADDGRLRVTGSTPNMGFGSFTVLGTDYFICGTDTIYDPTRSIITCPNGTEPTNLLKQRIYHRNGNIVTYTDRWAGGQTYHPGHGHNHVDDWVSFSLRMEDPNQPDTLQWPIIGTGAKIGFCLMDLSNCNASYGDCRDDHHYNKGNIITSTNIPNFGMGGGVYSCNPIEQGISVGYVDIYSQYLDGMWIDIPPGTCNGDYWIVAQVDPRNNFLETNDNNNWTAIPITLTKQTPQSGTTASLTLSSDPYLCNNSTVTLTASPGSAYQWSNGLSTQSITATQPGDYFVQVTSPCGVAYSDTVTITQITPLTPLAIGDTTCLGADATLAAAGGTIYNWYNNANGDTLLQVGATYIIDTLRQNTTVYAQSVTTVGGTSFQCPSELVAVTAVVEMPTPANIIGLGAGYLDTDAPVQVFAFPATGIFSGRGISTDGNNNTWFSPSQAGANDSVAITYRYTTAAGCAADTTIYISVMHNPGVGIAELADNRLIVYPNPAQSIVTIIVPNGEFSALALFDASGKQVMETPIADNTLRYQLDISSLPKGIYLVRLNGINGSKFAKLSKL